MTTTTRVLVAARLSRGVGEDEKSRIDRDDEDAQKWAADREGTEIVAVSKDPNVSGSVSPWKRPSLGPWLTDTNLIAQYDEIVASAIDRLGRNARDLSDLRRWAEDHGKTIRILSPSLSWPVADGDLGSLVIWPVLEALAEIEYRTTKKRYADARAAIKSNKSFYGRVPWGYRVEGDKYSKTLAVDPDKRRYLQGMVERALNGDTYLSICRWLDSEGVKTDQGDHWSPKSVAGILRNQALKGRYVDADGRPIVTFTGLLDAGEWNELQRALGRGHRGKTTSETALLHGVIVCAVCGLSMTRHTIKAERKDGTKHVSTYYRCKGTAISPSTCSNMVSLEDTDAWVDQWFTQDGFGLASTEIIETVTVPGADHAAEAAEVDADLRALDFDAPDWKAQQDALLAERNRIKALPSSPTTTERPTGVTVGEVWQSLDTDGRRSYLIAAGILVSAMSKAAAQKADPLTEFGGDTYRAIFGDPHKVVGVLQSITTK